MFNQIVNRIGYACKTLHHDQSLKPRQLKELEQPFNTRSTTVRWLNNQTRAVAEQRLWDLMEHNINAFEHCVRQVGSLPHSLRMVRLSSDCLPVYTEPTWRYYWQLPDVRAYLEQNFVRVGNAARELDVRLSFHPGQFCCIVSDRADVVDRTIEELEYHGDMIRWMGFGQEFQDFKCNIHLSGRRGAAAFQEAYHRLSPELKNTLTIENDEFGAGLDDVLPVSRWVPVVLDIHHHCIHSGEYITTSDPRIAQIQHSWRGVRPVVHYSYFRDEHLPADFAHDHLPSVDWLLSQGCKKQKLRAHSDTYPNTAANEWALSHNTWADIMCEAKLKNLAADHLWQQSYCSNTV